MPSPSRALGCTLSAPPAFFGQTPGSVRHCLVSIRKRPCAILRRHTAAPAIPGQVRLAAEMASLARPSNSSPLMIGLLPPYHHLRLIFGEQLPGRHIQGASRSPGRRTLRPGALLTVPTGIDWPEWVEQHGPARYSETLRNAGLSDSVVSPRPRVCPIQLGGCWPGGGQRIDLDSPRKSGYDENADMVRDAPYQTRSESRDTGG